MRYYGCRSEYTEPHHPWQNPAEAAIGKLKRSIDKVMTLTKCYKRAWYKLALHCAAISNITAKRELGWRTPLEESEGHTPDITAYLQFGFWQKVYYLDPKSKTAKFPETAEGKGR